MTGKILFIEAVQYGSYYQERYEHIQSLGYQVYVLVGEGESFLDSSYRKTAFTRDVGALTEVAQQWHAQMHFDAISTLAEPSVLACAHIAEKLGLNYLSKTSAMRSRNKLSMRQSHASNSVPHPQFLAVSAETDLEKWCPTAFPAIVKPTMGAASAFVFKANNSDELLHYTRTVLANTSTMGVANLEATGLGTSTIPEPSAIVESFLAGSEHLIEGYVFEGLFVLGSIIDRITVEGATFDDDVHHGPTTLKTSDVSSITNLVQQAVTSQAMDFSAVHAEIRFHEGDPYIVEVAARPGGGGLNHMANISYGYDPLKAVAMVALNMDPQHEYTGPTPMHTVAACVIGAEGVITAISGREAIELDERVFFFKLVAGPGTHLLRPPHGNSIVGFIGVTDSTFDKAVRNLNTISSGLTIEVRSIANVVAS